MLSVTRTRGRLARLWVLAFAAFFATVPLVSGAEGNSAMVLPADARIGDYIGRDVMIPMRDGVRLHAQIWRPATAGANKKLPMLMQRSPYGFKLERLQNSFENEYKELAAEGFIFVLQDIRGRFGSEGEFVMLRPKATSAQQIDESTDTYDSIEWLTKSLPDNNGNVGVFGISYGGWTAAMATIDPHPALKAVSVQASPEDMFLGDDFHHNGAFRLQYGWEYSAALETDGRTLNPFDFGGKDVYDWYLQQPVELAKQDRHYLKRALPTWQNFATHPNYDGFWKEQVTTTRLSAKVTVPNLIVAGWWDQEDFYGPLKIYEHQEKGDARGRNFIVIGPWNHGGWARGDGKTYGPIELGSATSEFFRSEVETRWFRHWLKNEGTLDQAEALVFQTGRNQWQRYKAWPPREGVSRRNLYLREGGKLSFTPAKSGEPASFVSDPASPVPYRERPIAPLYTKESTWPEWLADDQAPFSRRADVLSWSTEPLTEDVTIVGDVAAKLFASTTGSDADWVVKLIDVYPADEALPPAMRGRQLMIANDVYRARFRSSYDKPQAVPANQVVGYEIDLHSASHVFKKGHRIAVQVQSTWFPLIDRNPQQFVANIFEARPQDYVAQTHKVFQAGKYPSAISVGLERPGKLP
ncbi:CocE/NonD family hydrolase [Peristeroidobacter soli]|uniref:CocE/NonD family hydrolase n=1 Tax=Peristeroidobacter soli TaxID=2497877 RepID=UPI00158DF519|nr:CocE/NonD family hydrolase [Peristeroidobacter soli]